MTFKDLQQILEKQTFFKKNTQNTSDYIGEIEDWFLSFRKNQ